MDHPMRHPKFRTKLCRNYMSGQCAFGPKCSFIHPPPGLLPPYHSSSPFARQLLSNWNAFLPRTMTIPQAMQPVQTNSPISHFQGPFLADENPSLHLLSTTDAVNSGALKDARLHTPKQKRFPCRHFVRTGGWCPAGGQCKFLHDYSAVQYSTPRSTDATAVSDDVSATLPTDMYTEDGRTISGGVRMGVTPFCQNSSQAHSNETLSQCTHAQGVRPYPEQYLCSWYWQSQSYLHYPQGYALDHPIPLLMPVAFVVPPAVALNTDTPPDATGTPTLPTGTYAMNGTTYFPPLQTFASHPILHNQSPTVYDQSPNCVPAHDSVTEPWYPHELQSYLPDTPPNAASPSDPFSTASPGTEVNKLTTTQENVFPYRPPRNQRVGHARRISVNIKKSGNRS
ncbi:hypothetical protein F5I97DRAFT_158428 [Phlebopus sp. FC_14]|nr:hypothetical protein F5I97DRAFT_158428 [Phlebopus sp. FC_14]